MERSGLDKSEKNREGVPDPKKFERTGEKTFRVHADGGNYFEGEVRNPSVKMKPSGIMIFTNIGVCLRKCSNRDIKCPACVRFSEFIEVPNACAVVR